jgi:hypothetical protein
MTLVFASRNVNTWPNRANTFCCFASIYHAYCYLVVDAMIAAPGAGVRRAERCAVVSDKS